MTSLLVGLLSLCVAAVAQAQSATIQHGEGATGPVITQSGATLVVAENSPGPPPTPLAVEIVYDPVTDLVSLKSLDAPLGTVLSQIALKTSLTIVLPKEVLDERVSVEFNRLPLEHALKRLLEGFNSTLVYDLTRLAKVLVLSRKTAKSLEPRALRDQSVSEPKAPDYRQLAIRDPSGVPRALIEGGRDVTKGIADSLKESSSWQERERIVEALLERLDNGYLFPPDGVLAALKELAPERARDALVGRLSGADPRTRVIAAAALGRLGDERAIEPLMPMLIENDETTRRVAASSLALIGGQKAMDALLQSYVAGDDRIRYPVSVAIASFGDERSQKALAKLTAAGLVPHQPAPDKAGWTNPNW